MAVALTPIGVSELVSKTVWKCVSGVGGRATAPGISDEGIAAVGARFGESRLKRRLGLLPLWSKVFRTQRQEFGFLRREFGPVHLSAPGAVVARVG